MVVIDNLRVYVSNSSKKAGQLGSVRVKDSSGEVIASVRMPRSEPLVWLTKNASSDEAVLLKQQLRSHNVPEHTVEALLKQKPSRYEVKRLLRTA